MTQKKIFGVSTLLAAGYFALSLVYFFGAFFDPITKNAFREFIEILITFPASLIFGIGYGGGESAALIAGIVVFLAIWVISYLLTWTISMTFFRKARTHKTSGQSPTPPKNLNPDF